MPLSGVHSDKSSGLVGLGYRLRGQSRKLALDCSYSFRTTGEGCVFGLKVDQSVPAVLTVARNSATTYTGTARSIDTPNFTDNELDFGLFTYVLAIDRQKIVAADDWTFSK